MDQSSVRAIGGFHPITVTIINTLEKGKPRDEFTDGQLQKITGLNCAVGGPGYGYLCSAIRYCEKLGVIWQRQCKEGKILCLNGEEVFERSRNDLGRIRRTARRTSKRLSSVDSTTLPVDMRTPALALAAQLGGIVLMSRTETTKKIMSSSSAVPQIEDVMKIFSK